MPLHTLCMAGILASVTVGQTLSIPAPSGNLETIRIAESYLNAYNALDTTTLTALYAEDVVFIDPTSFATPAVENPVHISGKPQVMNFIASLKGVVLHARYELDRVYESSGRVVFIGDGVFTFASAPAPVTYRSALVTIITIEDGLVTEHRDYADYAGLSRVDGSEAE